MGSFNMSNNRAAEIFEVTVEGTFSNEDAGRFIEAYNKQVATFNAKEYTIDLDCTRLNVSSADVLPMLENCYKLYQASGFKRVIFKIAKNPVLKMQLSRIARTTGLTNYDIVEVA